MPVDDVESNGSAKQLRHVVGKLEIESLPIEGDLHSSGFIGCFCSHSSTLDSPIVLTLDMY